MTCDARVWLAQARVQCGLRGLKPSQLFPPAVLAALSSPASLWRPITSFNSSSDLGSGSDYDYALEEVRKEFVLQCFRRLHTPRPVPPPPSARPVSAPDPPAPAMPPSVVYSIAGS